MNDPLLTPFGLKWNPFSPAVPTEALLATPAIEHFVRRIEKSQVTEGGFALVTGDPGMGKSVVLRLLAEYAASGLPPAYLPKESKTKKEEEPA